jgi:hypothetical protein
MASNEGCPAAHVITTGTTINTAGYFDGGVAHQYHSLFVVSGAGVSAGVVAIEVSNDNVNWLAPATNTVTTSAASTAYSVTVGPLPFQFVRARISTAITGGSVDAYLASA